MYTPKVAEHISNPRNIGEIENPDATGDVVNQVCLDRIKLTIRIRDGVLIDARVQASGCPPTIAAASVLTELIIGKEIAEAGRLTRADIIESLGHLPPAKAHCAVLAIDALRTAIDKVR